MQWHSAEQQLSHHIRVEKGSRLAVEASLRFEKYGESLQRDLQPMLSRTSPYGLAAVYGTLGLDSTLHH